MKANIYLAILEIKKKKFFSLLMFLVCLIAMHMVLTSLTNATSVVYQQKIFERSLDYDMEKVLHLDYQYTEESPEFADVLIQYQEYITGLEGVEAVGKFDATGMYFSELKMSQAYQDINSKIVEKGKYASNADITQLLRVDEELLSFIKSGLSEYAKPASGYLPIYASEIFKNVLSSGTILTDEWTGEKYEIVGYFPQGSQWADENDLIRFPVISTDGWFIAPFSTKSESDIMTQLCCLHNTYILLSDNANVDGIKQKVSNYSTQHGFEANASVLAEEYEAYRLETESLTVRQSALAIFITIMAISSIIAVFTTNVMLKRKQYGILIANGFTLKDITACIATEITVIVLLSMLIVWIAKYIEFKQSTNLFRDILLTAHIQYTLPVCCIMSTALICIATWLPARKVFHYQPCELIGGNTIGNH